MPSHLFCFAMNIRIISICLGRLSNVHALSLSLVQCGRCIKCVDLTCESWRMLDSWLLVRIAMRARAHIHNFLVRTRACMRSRGHGQRQLNETSLPYVLAQKMQPASLAICRQEVIYPWWWSGVQLVNLTAHQCKLLIGGLFTSVVSLIWTITTE